MSDESNTIVLADEFNLYYLIKKFWEDKLGIIIITSIFAIGSIIYSLVVDEVYEISTIIKPADATEETTLNNTGLNMGFSIGGYTSDPVINNILITLKSDTFLETIYKKYPNEERLFGKGFLEIDTKYDTKLKIEEMKRYSALKTLHKVIKFGINTDHNTIDISVKLKDKYFAFEFLNEFLFTFKNYINNQNLENLENDIKFYNGLITKTKDPTIKQMLEKKLIDKIEKKFTMSSNVFTITTKPAVPAKRVYPKRSFMVISSTVLGGFLALFIVALKSPLRKIVQIIKDK